MVIMKCPAVCLVALALLGNFCDAQVGNWYLQAPRNLYTQSHRNRKPYEPPQQKESQAHVEVKRDFFGIGQLINPDTVAKVLVYESALQDCESELTTEDSLVYTFTLNYNPQPVGGSPVVRNKQSCCNVECHYQRKHNVSKEFLHFTMSLMTGKGQATSISWGDLIYIDVTVHQYFHVPLRVMWDYCVATLSPDQTSSPRYVFIDNMGSSSRYVARPEENKLCFQLEAFRFQGADSGMLYITCRLKATSTAYSVDQTHRACSYIDGWREISRADSVCASCEQLQSVGSVTSSWGTTGGANPPATLSRKIRDVSETQTETFEWVGDVRMGPISIADKPVA
uniref:Zona pellucida sperm-binding protein 3 n=1 Tax=Amphiprion percula TaxID=161767 RepID=A0A3P8S0P2_AMPPE